MTTNRKLDAFIFSGQSAAIDADFAREALASYLQDLELLSKGVPYPELGISKRREASFPSLISLSESDEIQNEVWNEPNLQSKSGLFAHMRLTGVMQLEDGMSSRGVNSLVNDIRTANANPNITGILLEVNSGGGEAIAGGALMNAVKDSKKPIVALVHRAGSAALRGILPASRIIASGNDAQAGSIGSFVTINRHFADWYNANYQDIYAQQSPNKNKDFRELLSGSQNAIQQSVNESARIFQRDVKSLRTLAGDEMQVEDTLSGGMFYAADAKKRGLVDEIGTFETAVRALQSEVRKAAKPQVKNEDMKILDEIKALLNGEKTEEATEETTQETTTQTEEVVQTSTDALLQAVQNLTAQVQTMNANLQAQNAGIEAMAAEIDEVHELLDAVTERQTEVETLIANKEAKTIGRKTNGSPIAESKTETNFRKTFKAQLSEVA